MLQSDASPLVVLLEDDAMVRYGQQMLLQDWGYDVVAASSLSDALVGLGSRLRDLAAIIADYDLGRGPSGAEAAEALRAQAGAPVATMLMSASFGSRTIPIARRLGFQALLKPIEPEQLRNWLAGVIVR